LPSSPRAAFDAALFRDDANLHPFRDEAHDALVRDPVLEETQRPIVARFSGALPHGALLERMAEKKPWIRDGFGACRGQSASAASRQVENQRPNAAAENAAGICLTY